jgi:Flp pilus assembly CpaF family ATPase
LSCLLNAVPAHERVVTCEEVFEVRLDRPDWVAMQTRQVGLEGTGEITLRRLVVEALRMRPHRLVVGEVRQAEALDLLVALNSGMPGVGGVCICPKWTRPHARILCCREGASASADGYLSRLQSLGHPCG